MNICQSAPSGDPWRETLLSHTPFPTVCERSLETFDKISRQSNQELLAEEKNFLPRANNQVLGGREGDFYPEKGEKDLMGREEGILLSAQQMEESLFSLQSLLISNSRELSSETSNWYRKMSRQAMFSFAQYHGKEVRPGTKVVGGRKWRQEQGFLVKPTYDMKGNQLGAKEEDLRWIEENKKATLRKPTMEVSQQKIRFTKDHLAVFLPFVARNCLAKNSFCIL